MYFQGLRGASSSLGIVTTIHANTFAAPSSTTIFEYTWDLTASAAASALAAFQTFVQEPGLPQEFAGELVLGAGSAKGRVNFGLTGGWYAPADQYAAVIAPFLAMVPTPQTKKLTVGTYINSVQYLGGLGRLNTTGIPDSTDTFYAKSLMTPTASPISAAAGTAFMTYLANQGFGTCTVRSPFFSTVCSAAHCVILCMYRTGLLKLSSMEEPTRRSTTFREMRRHSSTATPYLQFNSILRHLEASLHSLLQDSLC